MLNADGNVQFSYQSTAIESWLIETLDGEEEGGRHDARHAGRDRVVLA